jgi:hypothetical protein
MTRPIGDPIDESLATLDGVGASEEFTARVLAKLSARRETRKRLRRRSVTAAAWALVVAALTLPLMFGSARSSESEIADEAALLKREHARLESDLEDLRTSARESAPVLYLGGNDDVDLVLDLGPIIMQSAPSAFHTKTTGADSLEL